MADHDWRDEEATNETVFRAMNEWTEQANDVRAGSGASTEPYLCECSDRRCSDPIDLTRREYESVRSVPTWFAVASDHENPEIDVVVSEHTRYTVVEKVFRSGAAIARASDPRK